MRKHNFAFNKLIKCGECGASITGEVHNKFYKMTKRSASYTYYSCTKKLKPCSQKPITEPELETQIRKAIDDVALPQAWANDWYRWLERDEIDEQSNSGQNNNIGANIGKSFKNHRFDDYFGILQWYPRSGN